MQQCGTCGNETVVGSFLEPLREVPIPLLEEAKGDLNIAYVNTWADEMVGSSNCEELGINYGATVAVKQTIKTLPRYLFISTPYAQNIGIEVKEILDMQFCKYEIIGIVTYLVANQHFIVYVKDGIQNDGT